MSSFSPAIARSAPAFAPTGTFRAIADRLSRLQAAGAGVVSVLSRRRAALDALRPYMLKDLSLERLELPGGVVDLRPLPVFAASPPHLSPDMPADVRRGLDFARGL
jgi:hypothetical protein